MSNSYPNMPNPQGQEASPLDYFPKSSHFVIADITSKKPTYPPPLGNEWQVNPAPLEYAKSALDHPKRVVAIRPVSIGYAVVDVDKKHQTLGVDELREVVVESVGEPAFEYRTQSGGIHLWYRALEPAESGKWFYPPEESTEEFEGGDIRSRTGYLIMWDADTVAAGLEHSDQHDYVDVSQWPLKKHERDTNKTTGGKSRIREALDLISPDIYDDWVKVGMALHASDYSIELWEEWSSKSSKYQTGECQKKWLTFDSENASSVTAGTIYQMAGLHGHGGTRDGAGRPVADFPSMKTLGNKVSSRKQSAINFIDGMKPESHLRLDSPVDNDTGRVMHYCNDRVCYTGQAIYVVSDAMWRRLSWKDIKSSAGLFKLINESRQFAIAEVFERIGKEAPVGVDEYCWAMSELPLTGNHVSNVHNTLKSRADSMSFVPPTSMNDRRKHPILPLNNGTGIDLRNGERLSPYEVRQFHLIDTGWNVQPPISKDDFYKEHPEKMEDWEQVEYIMSTRYKEVSDRWSLYLAGHGGKRIDVMRYASDGGKTTWFDTINNAMTGVWGRAEGRGITQENASRFTPLTTQLAQHAGVLLDELHEEVTLSVGFLNRLTDLQQAEETKGLDRIYIPITGTVMMAAHEDAWPSFNSDAQGWENRFKWAVDKTNIDKMTTDEWRLLIQSPASKYCVSHYLIKRCIEQFQDHGSATDARLHQEEQDWCKRAVNDMKRSTSDPLIGWLRDNYMYVDDSSMFVTSASILEKATTAMERGEFATKNRKKLTAKGIAVAMRKSTGIKDLKPDRSTTGSQGRGFRGVVETVEISDLRTKVPS